MNQTTLDEYYGTLSETINALRALGYTLDFNVQDECLVCKKTNTQLSPEDFQIDKIYRFEGSSDPEDQSILYAISSEKFNVKGLLVNAYGMDADAYSSKLVSKLNAHEPLNETITIEPPLQRPNANRPLASPLTEINLADFISQIKNEKTWKEKGINSITIYKSDTMRMVLMGLHENAQLKPHSTKEVISLQVISGEINFTANYRTVTLAKEQLVVLAGGITHSVVARENSFLLLTLAMHHAV